MEYPYNISLNLDGYDGNPVRSTDDSHHDSERGVAGLLLDHSEEARPPDNVARESRQDAITNSLVNQDHGERVIEHSPQLSFVVPMPTSSCEITCGRVGSRPETSTHQVHVIQYAPLGIKGARDIPTEPIAWQLQTDAPSTVLESATTSVDTPSYSRDASNTLDSTSPTTDHGSSMSSDAMWATQIPPHDLEQAL